MFTTIRNKKALLRKIEVMTERQVLDFFNNNNFEKIGTGSSRIVYALNDDWVIKVAFCEVGELQNQQEHYVYNAIDEETKSLKHLLAKIYPSTTNRFVIMERCHKERKSEKIHDFDHEMRVLKNKTGYYKKSSTMSIDAFKYKLADNIKNKNRTNRLFKEFLLLECVTDGSILSDICIQNLGTKGSRVKVIDYGLSEFVSDIYDTKYNKRYIKHSKQDIKEYFKKF